MRSTNAVLHRAVAAVAIVAATVGCGGRHHLDEYRFTDRSLGLVWIEPPSPQLRHGWWDAGPDSGSTVLQTVIQAGSKVAKELEARKASARLDSAAANVDLATLLAARTIDRANRYLGTRHAAAGETPDYVLELNMKSFGIDARSDEYTRLFVKAEAVLMDRRTGREIWSEDVTGTDRLTPFFIGTSTVPSSAVNAVLLNRITVAQFQQALEQLVTYTATRISDELREDLRDVRDK